MLKHSDLMQWHGHGEQEVWGARRYTSPFVSECARVIYELFNQYVVVFEQGKNLVGEENPFDVGTRLASITNCFENIATMTVREYPELRDMSIIWIEHYVSPYIEGVEYENSLHAEQNIETFALVALTWNEQEQRYRAPRWTRYSRKQLEDLIGERFA